MAEIVFGSLLESAKTVFNYLRCKQSEENQAPRKAIGIAYPRRSGPKHHQYSTAAIQIFDDDDNYRGEKVLSVAYGPFYRTYWDKQMWKILKDNAWKHVLGTAGRDEETSGGSDDENPAKGTADLYFKAVREVEVESRQLYGKDESIDLLSSDEFVKMMVVDGCFLLQVALSVLGGFKRLEHLHDFPLLIPEPNENTGSGSTSNNKKKRRKRSTTTMIRVAVSSMFIVGNQIPLVVHKALMAQSFFADFVKRGVWEEPLDLERWVLYELLLVPMFHGRGRVADLLPDYRLSRKGLQTCVPLSIFRRSREAMGFGRKKEDPSEEATDLLHGLWLFMTGSSNYSKKYYVGKEDYSIYRDDDIIPDSHSSYNVILPTVRSATELKEVGVDFKYYKEGTSINKIRFRKTMLNASLILPRLVMVSEKEMFMLLNNLIRYELIHFGESRRIVCEYLQLMRGLIRSPEDAKILAADGIIIVDPNLEEKVPSVFQELDIPRLRSHHSLLRSVQAELNSYTHPSSFKKIGQVLSFVIILTLIQTVYTVLGYHLKD